MLRVVAAAFAVAMTLAPLLAHGQEAATRLSEEEIGERTSFLIERLEARERYADAWYTTWFATYTLGIVLEGVRAGLVSGENARTDHLVSMTKSVLAVSELSLRERNARFGADPVLVMPDGSYEERLARLEKAEELLRSNAKRARNRYRWIVHASTVTINAIGAGVLIAVDAEERAGVSAALGIAVGELAIWSEPRKPARDLEEYEERFEGRAKRSWSIAARPGGIAFELRF